MTIQKKYLVTGGCGFIGSHLVAALERQGHAVRVLDNLTSGDAANLSSDTELVVGDIVDADIMTKSVAGVDGVFHLAAIASVSRSIDEWVDCHRTNVTGSVTVFDVVRHLAEPIPVVYASSAAVYGNPNSVPINEQTPVSPLTAYGADKYGSELHALVASRAYKIPTVGLRLFNVYGPRQDPASPYSGVISIFAGNLLKGRDLTIFGDGEQVRDFIYVEDVVAHFTASMNWAKSGAHVFNACTGDAMSINELVRQLQAIVKADVRINFEEERRGDIRKSLGSPTSANYELGVKAEVPLSEGLRRTVEWLRSTKAQNG